MFVEPRYKPVVDGVEAAAKSNNASGPNEYSEGFSNDVVIAEIPSTSPCNDSVVLLMFVTLVFNDDVVLLIFVTLVFKDAVEVLIFVTLVFKDAVVLFKALNESAVAPPVIVIAPCIFKLLPSHVRNPSDAPPFKLSLGVPPSYPKYTPSFAA